MLPSAPWSAVAEDGDSIDVVSDMLMKAGVGLEASSSSSWHVVMAGGRASARSLWLLPSASTSMSGKEDPVEGGDDDREVPELKPKKIRLTIRVAPDKPMARMKAIHGWASIIMLKPEASKAGRRAQKSRLEAHEVIGRYVSDKATNTLITRLHPMSGYIKWTAGFETRWPPDEDLAIEYSESELMEKGKTAVQSFVGSLSFTAYIFGFGRSVSDAAASKYLAGLAAEKVRELGARKSAVPIDLEIVVIIELALVRGELTLILAVAAVGTLHLIYYRARCNDMDMIIKLEAKAEFKIAEVDSTKTAKDTRAKLRMMAPRETLSGEDWWSAALEVRESIGIPLEGGPLFPSYVEEQWIPKQACTGDIIKLVQRLLQALGVPDPHIYTSHACRKTLLNAATLYGMAKEETQRLAYHTVSGGRAIEAYTPDALVRPVQKLAELIKDFRCGKFSLENRDAAVAVGAESVNIESSSDEEVDCSDEESELQLSAKMEAAEFQMSEEKCDSRLFVNIHSGALHRGRTGDLGRMHCGRLIMKTYREIESEADKKKWLQSASIETCDQCFTKDRMIAKALMRRISEPLMRQLGD